MIGKKMMITEALNDTFKSYGLVPMGDTFTINVMEFLNNDLLVLQMIRTLKKVY